MMIDRALNIYQSENLITLISRSLKWLQSLPRQFYIGQVRHHTPVSKRTEDYNGVVIRPYRVADQYIPISLPPNQGGHCYPEEYEAGLVNSLKKSVSLGDKVIIIGAGLGVTGVIAAQESGSDGEITLYEGAKNVITHLEHTFSLNEVDSQINIEHAIVANAKRLDGPAAGAPTISVSTLDPCNVLELDCEGAEVEILSDLSIRPRTIIVETHNNKEHVVDLLSELDYEIIDVQLAERGPYEEICESHEIEVITARHPSR